MHKQIIGIATVIPDITNGIKAPCLSTLIASNGIQPTGDVLRIINATVISAVRMTVLTVNVFF
jgi:hypothetical protein